MVKTQDNYEWGTSHRAIELHPKQAWEELWSKKRTIYLLFQAYAKGVIVIDLSASPIFRPSKRKQHEVKKTRYEK